MLASETLWATGRTSILPGIGSCGPCYSLTMKYDVRRLSDDLLDAGPSRADVNAPGREPRTSGLVQRSSHRAIPRVSSDPRPVQRKADSSASGNQQRSLFGPFDSLPIQLKRTDAGATGATPASGSTGRPMAADVQASMEDSFQTDFSQVRVHQDGQAESMGAVAFARGNDLHFAAGAYNPGSQSGREVLGHELTHVVQQREGRAGGAQGFGGVINADPALEREADDMGARAARGERVREGWSAASSVSDDTVQRLAVAGTNWDDVGALQRTGGAFGAIIATDKEGAKPGLVLKFAPIREDVAGAHADLQGWGVEATPGARKVTDKGERATILAMLDQHAASVADQPGQKTLASQRSDAEMEIIVMEHAGQIPSMEQLDGTQRPQDPEFYRQLGLMVAYDQLTGNHDRIKVNVAGAQATVSVNLDNVLVRGGADDARPVPIDNTSRGVEMAHARQKLEAMQDLSLEQWNAGLMNGGFVIAEAFFAAFQDGLQAGYKMALASGQFDSGAGAPGKKGKKSKKEKKGGDCIVM